MAKGGVDTESASKLKKGGKKKPSDDDSIVGIEPEPETFVIDGPDVQALSIKTEDLERIKAEIEENRRKMSSKSNARTNKVIVRKLVDGEDQSSTKSQKKKYVVARRTDSENWEDEERKRGMQVDEHGEILDWSILGSKEQYLTSALANGDLDPKSTDEMKKIISKYLQNDNYEANVDSYDGHVKKQSLDQTNSKFNESNALDNWRHNMALRKRQQGYISTLLTKPKEKLVTSGTEFYREKQEVRDFIDRAIPSIDYGKGYRVGSEFWRQYESIGDKNTGLKMSLNLSERGEYQDITRIGKSHLVREEVGENYPTPLVRPRTEYLEQRTYELSKILHEMEDHKPQYDQMVVTGMTLEPGKTYIPTARSCDESDNQRETSDSSSLNSAREGDPLFNGPAIIMNGKMATYDKKSDEKVRITFDSVSDTQAVQSLTITNCGTTVLFYDWIKVTHEKSFTAQRNDETQRFYFNASPGSILPGNTANIPFVFKSPNGGYFSETWILTPRPALGKFKITLKGNAALPDFTLEKRIEIQRRLAVREANSAAKYVMDKILHEVKTPQRSPSPDCIYRTEEDNFTMLNPGFYYNYELLQQLKEIWREHVSPDDDWDLDLKVLRRRLFNLGDFDVVEEQQSVMNEICRSLQTVPIPLPSTSRHDYIKRALGDGIDKMCDQINWLKQTWNIAPTTPFPLLQRPTSSQTSVVSAKVQKEDKNPRKTPSGTRKANSGKGGKGGKDGKDDKAAAKKKSKANASKEKMEAEPPKSSTQLSNYSNMEGWADLNDPENEKLRQAYQTKLMSMTKEVLLESFDHIAALLTND